MSKQLIVITGLKRSGKDTAGDYLVKYRGYKKAQPLACFKPAIASWFGFTPDQMNGSLKEVIDERWQISPRQVMQIFGTDLMRCDLNKYFPKYDKKVGKNLWALVFKEWYLRQPDDRYVLCDWRFKEEKEVLKTLDNVTFVRVNNQRCNNTDMHSSEAGILDLEVDYEIQNNGTLEEYYNTIDKFVFRRL